MKIFLSSLENGTQSKYEAQGGEALQFAYVLKRDNIPMKWNLMSYYYIRSKEPLAEFIRDNSEEILIDSGAHSFQKGVKVDWLEYTKRYAEFIKRFDRPHVIGYFEMDVDNIIGYDKVLQLRKILESVSNKIIPVWHKNRGVDDYKAMCKQYAGKVVAVTGFKNEDIRDEQYLMFVKYAREHGCRIHCLGMTRKAILDKVPFDYVDSSSWKQQSLFGRIAKTNRKVTKEYSNTNRTDVWKMNYLHGIEMQKHYFKKWHKECWRNSNE
jgi:hypothetical protein